MNYARFLMILVKPQSDYNNLCVDHINLDKTDDRIENLRWVTFSDNSKNRKKYNRMRKQYPIIIKFENGETITYTYQIHNIINIPYTTIYSLANAKQGSHYSKKYKISCYYQKD